MGKKNNKKISYEACYDDDAHDDEEEDEPLVTFR